MKILIVGNNINSLLAAQYIKMQNSEHDIYLTTDSAEKNQYYTPVMIAENDVQSLKDFVKYNQIEFTIVMSSISIINGVADVFASEDFPIFAPLSEAARITFFNSIAKKIMYKLKINTPKFGIFDREAMAIDYIRRSKFPVVVKNDFTLLNHDSEVFRSFSKAKTGLQRIFEGNIEKIVIENYIDTEPLYLYFITDGYNALPLVSIDRVSGNGYGTACAPAEKLSEKMVIDILKRAIYPLLDDISKYAGAYTGVIGLKLKIYRNNFYIMEFYNAFQQYDFQVFLSLLNDDLLTLMYNAAKGVLAENHEEVYLNRQYSYTVSVEKQYIYDIDDDCDYTQSQDGLYKIYTNTALTLSYAKKGIMSYLREMCDDKIISEILEEEQKKELRL